MMITRRALTPYYLMSSLIVALLVVAAGAGVITRAQIYTPFLSPTLVAFQFFQDLLSLVLSPCLLAVMILTRRGSLRAFVIWNGLLIFVLYYYSFYVLDPVYTVYYPLYLALIGLPAYTLLGLLTAVDLKAFAAAVDKRFPARLLAAILAVTVLFAPIWLMLMIQGIKMQQPPEAFLVFVFDLCFLIPACIYTAVKTWQRQAVGYLLAGPLLLKAALSGVLLFGGEILKTQLGLPLAPEQLVMYTFLAVCGSFGLGTHLRHIRKVPAATRGERATLPAPYSVP